MNNVVNMNGKKAGKYITLILVGIVVLFLIVSFISAMSTVPSGFVGVKTQFGAVTGSAVQPGLALKIPYIQDIQKVDCRIQKFAADANAASKDMQVVTSKIAVNFAIDSSKATTLFKEIGVNYAEVIISPAVQEVVKSITAQYTAEELIGKRGEVSSKMTKLLSDKISSRGVLVYDFNVINFEFTAEFNKAIEQKQIAQQQKLKAEQDLGRIKIEAQQKVVQAQAEADSLKLQKQEITPELLELRKIEAQISAINKWDGKLPAYSGGALPFIDIEKATTATNP